MNYYGTNDDFYRIENKHRGFEYKNGKLYSEDYYQDGLIKKSIKYNKEKETKKNY